MNIAHLLPYSVSYPLAKHHGRHDWVLRLALLQAQNGHTVTIYSSPASGKGFDSIIWKSSPTSYKDKSLNNIANIKSALMENSHDIYHSHFDFLHEFLGDLTVKPFIYTQHWFPNQAIADAVTFNVSKNVLAVPATFVMEEENRRLGIPSTKLIRQGIDLSLFKYFPEPVSDRLIFVGRIAPHKGVLEAVKIAHKVNMKLDIVGKINTVDEAYWQQILPYVDGKNIAYLGPKSHTEIAQLFSKAKALIFPSQAPEASPQVPIEAQACGTPVIISDIGATKEWVDHGKSGFVVASSEAFINALGLIDTIDRSYCRKFAENFDLKKMVINYDELYQNLVKRTS